MANTWAQNSAVVNVKTSPQTTDPDPRFSQCPQPPNLNQIPSGLWQLQIADSARRGSGFAYLSALRSAHSPTDRLVVPVVLPC
jgi:hypothetical protein